MTEPNTNILNNRVDIVFLADVQNGNPNGDPGANGEPRKNPLTNQGQISDACDKRKIRDYVQMIATSPETSSRLANIVSPKGQLGFDLYIDPGMTLNERDMGALSACGYPNLPSGDAFRKELKSIRKNDPTIEEKIRDYMCQRYFDIRAFGAVMTTFTKGALNCGQVCGPVQFGIATSIDPIFVQPMTLTRKAITTLADREDKETELVPKHIVPYALYRHICTISADKSQRVTGFTEFDLELLIEAIRNMYENDRSASRGIMTTRKVAVFRHESAHGNAPLQRLIELVKVERTNNPSLQPTCYDDYNVSVDMAHLPDKVSCTVYDM